MHTAVRIWLITCLTAGAVSLEYTATPCVSLAPPVAWLARVDGGVMNVMNITGTDSAVDPAPPSSSSSQLLPEIRSNRPTAMYASSGFSFSAPRKSLQLPLTLAVWVQFHTDSTFDSVSLFSLRSDSNPGNFFHFYLFPTAFAVQFKSDGACQTHHVNISGHFLRLEWSHFAVVLDVHSLVVYVNGFEYLLPYSTVSIDEQTFVHFGSSSSHHHFAGNIDDLLLFNTSLASSDVDAVRTCISDNLSECTDHQPVFWGPTYDGAWHNIAPAECSSLKVTASISSGPSSPSIPSTRSIRFQPAPAAVMEVPLPTTPFSVTLYFTVTECNATFVLLSDHRLSYDSGLSVTYNVSQFHVTIGSQARTLCVPFSVLPGAWFFALVVTDTACTVHINATCIAHVEFEKPSRPAHSVAYAIFGVQTDEMMLFNTALSRSDLLQLIACNLSAFLPVHLSTSGKSIRREPINRLLVKFSTPTPPSSTSSEVKQALAPTEAPQQPPTPAPRPPPAPSAVVVSEGGHAGIAAGALIAASVVSSVVCLAVSVACLIWTVRGRHTAYVGSEAPTTRSIAAPTVQVPVSTTYVPPPSLYLQQQVTPRDRHRERANSRTRQAAAQLQQFQLHALSHQV